MIITRVHESGGVFFFSPFAWPANRVWCKAFHYLGKSRTRRGVDNDDVKVDKKFLFIAILHERTCYALSMRIGEKLRSRDYFMAAWSLWGLSFRAGLLKSERKSSLNREFLFLWFIWRKVSWNLYVEWIGLGKAGWVEVFWGWVVFFRNVKKWDLWGMRVK